MAQQLATQNLVQKHARKAVDAWGPWQAPRQTGHMANGALRNQLKRKNAALRHGGPTPPHARWSVQHDMMRRGIKL